MLKLKRVGKKDSIALLLIIIVILFSYGKVIKASFQQDEWYSLANYLVTKEYSIIDTIRYFTQGSIYFPRPLGSFLSLLNFRLFGIEYSYYYFCSIFFHIAVTLSLYYLALIATKKRIIAFLASLFFAVNSTHHQAITWISASFGSPQSALFVVWSLIFYFKYLMNEQKKKKYQYLSLLCLLVALLFKETAGHLLLLLPVMHYILAKDKKPKKFLKEQIPLMIMILVFVCVLFSVSLFPAEKETVEHSRTLVTGIKNIDVLFYRALTLPLTAIVDVYFKWHPICKLSKVITKLSHPFFYSQKGTITYHVFVETAGVNLASYYIALFILLCILFTFSYLKRTDKKLSDIFLIFFFFTILSSLPLIFSRSVSFFYLESRYIYIPAIGGSFILAVALYAMVAKIMSLLPKEKSFIKHCIRVFILTFMLIIFCSFHIRYLKREIKELVSVSTMRTSIIEMIEAALSPTAKRMLIYVKSNREYYQAGNILPLQCGPGYLFLTRHSMNNPEFIPLLKNDFLWNLSQQGYLEENNVSFGYFRDYQELKNVIKQSNSSARDVYAFEWDGDLNKLTNITERFRESLSDITTYISAQPFDNSINIGIPDGKQRTFLSERFIYCAIMRVVNLVNNEEWFPCDFVATQSKKILADTNNCYITYNYGLEPTYGGTTFVYYCQGNGTDTYVIPGKIYQYETAGLQHAVSSDGARPKRIFRKENGDFEVVFPSICDSSQTLQFGLLINAKVLYYKLGEGINDIAIGRYAEARGNGTSKKFVIPLSGVLKSLRSYWESNDLRYQPKAFVNGVMTQIISWSGIDTTFLTIEFEEPPEKDAIIKIPILISYAPKPEDIIKVSNF